MNTKRNSKNAVENRGATTVIMCTTCGQQKKPFRVLANGKSRMAYECNCGILDKLGNKI